MVWPIVISTRPHRDWSAGVSPAAGERPARWPSLRSSVAGRDGRRLRTGRPRSSGLSFQRALIVPEEAVVTERHEEITVRADADHVLRREVAPRLDFGFIDVRPIRRVVVHQNEPPLLGTEHEIGMM